MSASIQIAVILLKGALRFLFLEASRRLGDQWTLEIELRIFLDQPPTDFLFDLRDDDLLQLALLYHF